ncbi:uncharacterized protein LOC122040277 [Zingiber officinale]|uniref:uncharacterized protein LOC122040277 n=1 Tax=Zingiber officinale TaxID=94328 RepID=UPI001C4CD116|nr:uncharacterized protein LOC122040277 [Zingiber officinale]
MMDHYKRRREQEGTLEDRLTSLHDDLLISILSFLSIKQRVALSAVCARFRLLLPSVPRLDTFRLDVGRRNQELTFPRALVRQCRIVFRDVDDFPKPLEQLLVDDLVEAGVQDLTLETSGKGWLYVGCRENSGFFNIKSLRSLFLDSIQVSKYADRRPLSPLGCAFLTSLKMKFSVISDDFLRNLFASCPFLETLQLIRCYALEHGMNKLSFHSSSIKHLIIFEIQTLSSTITIDVCAPQLESLIVPVVATLLIEAPKVRNASFLLSLEPPADPAAALMKLFRASFRRRAAWLSLNSSRIPNILAAGDGIYQVISPKYREYAMIFKLDFNFKDQSSTTILTELLKKCNECNTEFDIHVDPTRMQSSTKTAKGDQHLLYGSTGLELINLQMMMPKRRFERFLSDQKKMKKFKDTGLEMLRRRTSKEQFMDILASQDSLFKVSSNIDNCIEMKI